MSRIQSAFDRGTAFIGFVTGGDPSLDKTEEFVLELARAGADIVEIGIPFSDPIAEGPTIQKANIRALSAGTTVDKLLELVRSLRQKTQIPLLFMTYLNPVFHYGYDRFFAACKDAGLDGIIIPDLPVEERGEALGAARANGIDLISMVAPTSGGRIATLVEDAEGFIYTVSSMGVTGVRSELGSGYEALLSAIKAQSKIPVAAGFGIGTPQQAAEVAAHADGVIVGSALVSLVEQYGDEAGPRIFELVSQMTQAMAGRTETAQDTQTITI